MKEGIVVKSTGSRYQVICDNSLYICYLRGKFKQSGLRSTNPVAVGDKVNIILENKKGIITQIAPRHNYLVRKSTNLSKKSHIIAANIDYAVLVFCIKQPTGYPLFIDRYLVACEAALIPPLLVFNKIDLLNSKTDQNTLEEYLNIYKNAGYPCLTVSAQKQINIEKLRDTIAGKTVVFSGNSGVGKSSLINLLNPNLSIKTAEISTYYKQGKHTTTFAEMHPWEKGFIIDTPGIKGFGFADIDRENLSAFFPEMQHCRKACKFNNCTHTHEPDCAVKEALNKGEIHASRYKNYLRILTDKDNKYRNDLYGENQ
ncbi:MAG: ribosome small subunit-dependent GTPase A [Bacteroidia bacterium]|nr:MAG: ribosome small subunit-dependent GTPase A [Bacteroidia bacterium]